MLPASGPFDVVFTRLVLLHLPDPAAAMAQMGRCLKPGGLLYVVDCDDNANTFDPMEPWQGELKDLMAQSQALRGGTRSLGPRLLELMGAQGFWPEGSQALYYSTDTWGIKRWKDIFLPEGGGMAARDLQYLVDSGALEPAKLKALAQSLVAFFARPDARAQICSWHAWGRKIPRA